MLERYDESELLDLIEGELDPRRFSALQQRLAGDPQARAMLEAMMRDRSMLRAIGEPALPHDFLAQIEPLLARPMLIEHVPEVTPLKPGEFRRQHRRAHRRLRLGRLAAAAMLLLAALGGAWALFDGLGLRDLAGGNGDRFASDGQSAATGRDSRVSSADSSEPNAESLAGRDELGSGVVHHDRPPPDLMRNRMAARDVSAADAADAGERTLANADVIPAEFAIVVSSRDPAAAEAALSRVVAGLGERGALVKNFSFAEAQRLAEKHRLAHGGAIRRPNDEEAPMIAHAPGTTGTPGAPAAGVMSRSDLYDLAQRVRDQLRSDAASQGETPAVAAPTNGDSILAPTLEQQLEFSSRGATHTVAMPASELAALIERLSLSEGQTTLLRMLPETPMSEGMPPTAAPSRGAGSVSSTENADASTEPMLLWLTQGPMVRQAMERLSRDNHIVLVPVMVK